MSVPYRNRSDAGRVLAGELQKYRSQPSLLVLGLPRGGVPVAFEVASALQAELDVFIVRKLGLPGHSEFAIGALASGGVRVLDEQFISESQLSSGVIEALTARERRELERRERLYRKHRPPLLVRDRTVILVDDGLATGSTMLAAIRALRPQKPGRLIVAVPVAGETVCSQLRAEVDEMVCGFIPDQLYSVGMWYEDFSQTTDEEVQELLNLAAAF
ncbi:MAG TPA: phosphoribosyltransferase [Bryobacteraceae bacterium]|nr:phosphoribosyltransferase [Bryobacteraceae bacterium]